MTSPPISTDGQPESLPAAGVSTAGNSGGIVDGQPETVAQDDEVEEEEEEEKEEGVEARMQHGQAGGEGRGRGAGGGRGEGGSWGLGWMRGKRRGRHWGRDHQHPEGEEREEEVQGGEAGEEEAGDRLLEVEVSAASAVDGDGGADPEDALVDVAPPGGDVDVSAEQRLGEALLTRAGDW